MSACNRKISVIGRYVGLPVAAVSGQWTGVVRDVKARLVRKLCPDDINLRRL
ncbi:hypothetical protein [Methylosarcina fibrata]|uniref:hypothetical protein n=1 Tax=Methylosarcina fibrata TaxID=105972 RepID=UPI00035E30AF|nr:hypothetical protein [Methylosarcina fibrata]